MMPEDAAARRPACSVHPHRDRGQAVGQLDPLQDAWELDGVFP
eukprot:CAMPEP_0172064866 /NCGR_PEP_ID=MMETSP1043-20130122/10331_1 /TAXON_ID=464988 /ORGANISM="Hemiselmis andersenii, Strain CCMP441" /LENGTH=42 /DNA_ID= /DNA_START= /DNA_END= /DNA_ORIENTATION=